MYELSNIIWKRIIVKKYGRLIECDQNKNNFKLLYFRKEYEEKYGYVIAWRNARNNAVIYSLVKTVGGVLCLSPVHYIIDVTYPIHKIPPVDSKIIKACFIVSSCLRELVDKIPTQKKNLESKPPKIWFKNWIVTEAIRQILFASMNGITVWAMKKLLKNNFPLISDLQNNFFSKVIQGCTLTIVVNKLTKNM